MCRNVKVVCGLLLGTDAVVIAMVIRIFLAPFQEKTNTSTCKPYYLQLRSEC